MKIDHPGDFHFRVIAAPKQLAGVAFIVDKSVDDRYKEAARYIVKTIQVEKDLAGEKREVAKPISN